MSEATTSTEIAKAINALHAASARSRDKLQIARIEHVIIALEGIAKAPYATAVEEVAAATQSSYDSALAQAADTIKKATGK